ncbi:HEAT repeat domain-containing protein [Danxiaibacter flavus]|uniref:HEAT repeat domain-containing protein n=1 Tax=Danxiaibacter flavus TaxID=3049108 RepID=A0ABV3ZF31_9BACT|nr:HEAT repeat domain-containing protein [Chitinophagaceae bacterium DXS]
MAILVLNPLQVTNFFMPAIRNFAGLPVIMQIAICFIIISVALIVYIQFRLFIIRYKGHRLEQKKAKLVPFIDGLITEHILMRTDIDSSSDVNSIIIDTAAFNTPQLSGKESRQILIDRIISYKKGFSGTIALLLRKLYQDLEFDKVSYKKMNAFKWSKKIKGIRELVDMDAPISDVIVLPLTNSKHRELRAEARNAYIKLSKNEPFKFFDISTEPLLMWEQIELFKTITTTKDISIPNFARWITYSNNKSIISFCLKLIVHYKQTDAAPAIVKLLDNKDHTLRAEAINTLGKIKYLPAEDQLIHLYTNQPLTCQLEILKAIGRMETGRNIQFLKQEFLYSTDFDVRKNAAKSIIMSDAQDLIDELFQSSTPENKLILKHAMNPLIKY